MSLLDAAAQTIEDSPETLSETVDTISTNFHVHYYVKLHIRTA